MALSVNDTLETIVLAKNPVVVVLAADDGSGNPYPAQGMQARMTSAGDRFAEGEWMSVTYTEPDGTSETVTFTATPGYTEEDEIPDDSFGGSLTEYIETVRAKVQAHHRIAPYFTVTRTGPIGGWRIILQALSADDGWDVSTNDSAGFTNDTIAATTDSTPENYRVLLEVYFEETYLGGDYVLAAQLEGRPDENGEMLFDISNVLDAQCRANRAEPMVPVFGTAAPALADNLRRYYVRFTEEYGQPAEVQDWQYLSVRHVLHGGVSQALFGQYNYIGSGGWLGSLSSAGSLLTWMPDGKTINTAGPEYLAWYNYTGADAQVCVEVVKYSVTDGSASAPQYAYTDALITVKPYETLLIPVSPDVLEEEAGISLAGTDYKMAVRVVDATSDWEGGDPVYMSQARTYYIDRLYYESERYVQYLNAFGCPEMWRCTGELDQSVKIDRLSGARTLQPGYNELATDQYQYARTFEQQMVYRTGYLRKGDADVLQELLLAGELYDVSEDGYIPLRIIAETFQVTNTRQDQHSYQFNASPRLSMRNYSKTQVAAQDANAWQEISEEAWFTPLLLPWTTP